ncbi:MAG: helix-turn-helix domain-containing protein [Paludibacteraceae bacterium]|nr:helix-turn-helix domain-containing protein [Paludibacteraceae bacterium]
MNLQERIGQAIVQLRKQKNLSQEQLALQADSDRRYMSDIENGKRNVSIDILERISKVLEKKVSELLVIAEKI